MAYGGGGFAISYPFAKALERMQDGWLDRYPYLFGSDDRIQACMAALGVPLIKEPRFHQEWSSSRSSCDRPSCFRYPRGNGVGAQLPPGNKGVPLEIGKGRILAQGSRIAFLGYGTMVQNCLAARSLLHDHGLSVTVADARFCKPLDHALVRQLAKEHEVLITVEEGSIGGFGSHVVHFLAVEGLLDGKLKWRPIVLPDHGSPQDQMAEAGLTASHIAATA